MNHLPTAWNFGLACPRGVQRFDDLRHVPAVDDVQLVQLRTQVITKLADVLPCQDVRVVEELLDLEIGLRVRTRGSLQDRVDVGTHLLGAAGLV